MGLSERVLLYCERGRSEALFAEPFNAASNAAFLLAALVALMLLRRPRLASVEWAGAIPPSQGES